MSILGAGISTGDLIYLALGVIVSLPVLLRSGALRAHSVCGPERVDPSEPPGLLLAILVSGFAAWLLGSSAAVTLLADTTTRPTTLPARMEVWVGISGEISAMVVLLGANLILRPGGLGLMGLSPRRILGSARIGVLAALFVLPAMAWVGVGTMKLWELIRFEHPEKHDLLKVLDKGPGLALEMAAIFTAVVLAPVFEELLFRGHLQTFMRRALTQRRTEAGLVLQARPTPALLWLAIVCSSAAFAAVHPLWMFPPIFFLALCLGYLYERTGSLWVCIIVHAIFNASQIVLSMAGA